MLRSSSQAFTGLAALLLTATAGCGSEDGVAGGLDASAPPFGALSESEPARVALADLRARFLRVDAAHPELGDALGGPLIPGTEGSAPGSHPGEVDGLQVEPDGSSRPAIAEGVVTAFERVPGGVRPISPKPGRWSLARIATVTLPEVADGVVRIEDERSGVAVSFALREAGRSRLEVAEGLALYADAAPGGGHLVHRPHAEGTEDHVVFEARPPREELRYEVDVSRVAGLRLVGNSLEFLDARGTPQVRVAPPSVVDATGATLPAWLAVDGCEVDTDPRAPWGRAVTAPGARLCSVRVTWADVEYPAVIDPNWTTTGSLATARIYHRASLLGDGRLLVTGGNLAPALTSCELYDPTTRTWSSTGSMATGRYFHSQALLNTGQLLVAGGNSGTAYLASTELYDPSTGTWATAGNMLAARAQATATHLTGRDVLVAGGYSGSYPAAAQRYNYAGTPFWSNTGSLTGRAFHTASRLGSGRVLVAGGNTGTGVIATAQYYEPATGLWTATGSLATARYNHTAAVLGDGRVLVAAGTSAGFLASAELYDPASGTWTATGSLVTGRRDHMMALLGDGRVLVAGGTDINGPLFSAEIYDPAAGIWRATASMAEARAHATLSTLTTGGALAVGGQDPAGLRLASAELFEFLPDGEGCASGADCASTYCVDGVCCGTACTGTCMACSAAKQGGGVDGVCGTIPDGVDPDSECGTQGTGVCAGDGVCSGAGNCRSPLQGTVCNPSSCASAAVQNNASLCDGNGTCAPSTTSPCAPYVCSGTACLTSCINAATDCAAGSVCYAGLCGTGAPNGAACAGNAECTSRFCADGVCCDRACSGTCEACTTLKKGAGLDGECGPVSAGNDPDSECATDAVTTCQRDGSCDGAGACRLYASGAACGSAQCVGNAPQGQLCDGFGACRFGSTGQDCGAYRCVGGTCPASCGGDGDCIGGAYCGLGRCQLPGASGAACTADTQCQSGHCTDGVCCNAVCDGACEWCGDASSPGVCVVVTGAPLGAGKSCGLPGSGACGPTCDGTRRDGCTYPAQGTTCGAAMCQGDSAVAASTCDGSGTCAPGATEDCGEYTCEGGACKTSCVTSADCKGGSVCNLTTSTCSPGGATCQDGFSARATDGTISYCNGYRCVDGSGCQQTCATSTDCDVSQGYSCAAGVCTRADGGSGGAGGAGAGGTAGAGASGGASGAGAAAAAEDGGCGCAAPGRRTVTGWAALALGALVFARRRRAASSRLRLG